MFYQLCNNRNLICSRVITVSYWLLLLLLLAHSGTAWAFHLSFGHRLSVKAGQLSAVNSPQLNPASSLLRPIECRNANNHSEVGICMFSIDCMQNKGVPLSICKHNYFVGTCCRLPDHNNFVGIVYDLRETETNHLLEAREVLGLKEQPSSSSSSSSLAPVVMEAAAAAAAFETGPAEKNSTVQQQQQQPLESVTTPTTTGGESLDDRYRISSTSLFGPAAGATSQPPPAPGESARNADGSASLVFAGSPILAAAAAAEPSKLQLDTNQLAEIHLISNSSSSITAARISQLAPDQQQQQQPPPLSESLPRDPNELEVLNTFNSVHSPPMNLMASKPAQVQQQPQISRVVFEQAGAGRLSEQGQQSTVYELPASSSQVQLQAQTTAGPPESSGGPSAAAASEESQPLQLTLSKSGQPPATTGDQEFTLSTSGHSDHSTFVPSSPAAHPEAALAPTTQAAAAALTGAPSASEPAARPTQEPSSTFVDLVSSSRSNSTGAGAGQTTTPFTVSLSTAQLPSISAQSYAPTQQPTVLVSSNASSPRWPTTAAAAAAAASSPTGTAATQSSGGGGGTTSSYESSLANFSQLYSNQHSPEPSHGGGGHSKPGNNLQQQQQHSNSQLHVASKIVAGSSSSSNLIPGLSSLQSAILSHIPFKIASGLSSYLQAAMKPTGSKPLLASNTAPFLQYNHNHNHNQHHHQHQQPNSTRPQPPSSLSPPLQTAAPSSVPPPSSAAAPTSAVRFPDESPASGAGPPLTASTVSFPAGATASAGPTSALPSSSAAAAAAATSATHDVVRESQRVCGRPQVAAHSSSVAPLAEGAKRRVARIVGGNQSAFGQWPWMVSLRQWRKGAFLHKCGAALLNENWAITAAHCVEDVKVADLLLRLGEFDVSNQEEPYPFVERRVRAVKSHPLFNPKTFEYDLALLKFAEPIKYERNIIPVCVPSGNDSYVDRMATVIGWGRLYEDGPLPDVIQHVDVPIITNNECEKMYKNAGYVEEIPDMFICAGISKGGRDSCEGDSGGPLTMVDHDGRSYLVGIISWGIGCALPSQPGVYTRITAFSGWINELAGS